MSGFNQVTICGRLGKDPEVRNFQNGGKVVNMSLATSEKWKDKSTNEMKEVTHWHRVAIFNENIADIAERFLKSGDMVLIQGKLENRKWVDNEGVEKYSTEVVLRAFGSQLTLLPNGKREGGAAAEGSGGGGYERQGGFGGGSTDRGQTKPKGGGGWDEARAKRDLDDDIPF